MTAKVEIYATSYCRHCMDARELLQAKGIEYDEYLLDLMPLEKDIMIERCGQKSVPQILIDGNHIGGLSEFRMLDKSGQLRTEATHAVITMRNKVSMPLRKKN